MKIGIDVDDVVADLMTPWLNRCNALLRERHGYAGPDWMPDDLDRWDFGPQIGLTEQEIWEVLTPDIYQEVKPVVDARRVLEAAIAMGHEIAYVTSCHTIEAYDAKVKWLQKHMPWSNTLGAYGVGPWSYWKTKAQVHGQVEWLVDDHVKNCEEWPGFALLQTRPHNRRTLYAGKRIKSLVDLLKMLQYTKPVRVPAVPLPEGTPYIPPAPGELWGTTPSTAQDGDEGINKMLDRNSFMEVYEQNQQRLTVREQAVQTKIAPAGTPILPSDWSSRKDIPMCTGVLDYFPLALAEIARISKAGNDQHNPGQPLHWARGKSTDHADCVIRHLAERGTLDIDNMRHTAKMAWRALALLQEEMEDALAGRPGFVNPNRRNAETEQQAA